MVEFIGVDAEEKRMLLKCNGICETSLRAINEIEEFIRKHGLKEIRVYKCEGVMCIDLIVLVVVERVLTYGEL